MDFQLLEKDMYGDVENDEELMAELLALEAEERAAGQISSVCIDKTRQCNTRQHTLGHHESVSQSSRRTSSAYGISSVSDVSDEDLDDGDEEEDVNDPELLAELSDLVRQEDGAAYEIRPLAISKPPIPPRSVCESAVNMTLLHKLQELKEEYTSVLKDAKGKNDALRIKRYQRGFNKIEELVRKVQAGKMIDENEIPVSIKAIRSAGQHAPEASASVILETEISTKPVQPAEIKQGTGEEISEPSGTYQKPVKNLLRGVQLSTELSSRRESYIKNAKAASAFGDKKKAYEYYVVAKQFDEAIKAMNDGQVTECEENELPPPAIPYRSIKHDEIPSPPKTLQDGLQQRMQKYKTLCDQSRTENDDRKYRMNARILKRYEDALKACRSNRPVDISDLPCPPGYPPLPPPRNMDTTSINGVVNSRKPLPEVGPFAAAESSISGRQSRQKQQLEFLLKRQLQFKEAAIAAKKKGDMTTAKKFLLVAKGFDKMIAASKNGFPVNIEKTPVPPQVRASAKTLKPSLEHHTSFDAAIKGTPTEIFATMERDLIYQVKLCEEYRLAFTQLGDVTRVKMFETWSTISKRDLILLRELAKRGAAVPQFRYETRNIPSVEVCFEVDEQHIELTIIKITEAKLPAGWKPSDGYLFVKYNFAFPHDAHQTGRTKVIASTNSPEYNQKFLLTINRKTKQLQRIIRRNCLKFEIYQKGGFLRSDKLIATADCKLTDLEEKVCIYASIDLMEGRKQTGGKLNYQVRVREPLSGKRLSITQKKWLVLEL
uniref:C2 domain-containing protein n=1 Tax=Elaeophora elaphi TaxID=1147741 RepID=A0A0R3RRE9_9BILA